MQADYNAEKAWAKKKLLNLVLNESSNRKQLWKYECFFSLNILCTQRIVLFMKKRRCWNKTSPSKNEKWCSDVYEITEQFYDLFLHFTFRLSLTFVWLPIWWTTNSHSIFVVLTYIGFFKHDPIFVWVSMNHISKITKKKAIR